MSTLLLLLLKKTPETGKFYNETKYGVDVVDQMARKRTTRASNRRWPIRSFENTIDLVDINSWIVYKETTSEKFHASRF
jgi:hypothetical protein